MKQSSSIKKRKTNGRYRLVFIDFLKKKQISITCDVTSGMPLSCFSKNGNKGLDLSILDQYIIQNFNSVEELRSYLNKIGYSITEEYEPKIVYQSHKKTRYLEVIFQDQRLYALVILYNKYKDHFSDYLVHHRFLNIELRKLISDAMQTEELWKWFYEDTLKGIHNFEFYSFIKNLSILDSRTMYYITEYLSYEKYGMKEHTLEFEFICKTLINIFTSYKVIRGMCMCMQKYQLVLEEEYHEMQEEHNFIDLEEDRDNVENFIIGPMDLLSEEQLAYLEKHKTFCELSLLGKEEFISEFSSFIVPWHQKTIRPLTEEEIYYFEKHGRFNKLLYSEKIALVNQCLRERSLQYQKKR